MKRKLIKQGKNALTITLPAKWVETNGLKSGNLIELLEEHNVLKISTEEIKKEKKIIKIAYSDQVLFLKRVLINLYRKGYDEITITTTQRIPFTRVTSKLDELIGFEIVEHTEKKLVVRNLSTPIDEEFDNTYRRFYRLTLTFAKEVLRAIKTKKYKDLKDIASLDKQVNRLYNFCVRIINQKINDFSKKGLFYIQAITYIEQIGDQLDEMSKQFSNPKLEVSKGSIKLFETIIQIFENVYELSYEFDFKKLETTEKIRENLFSNYFNREKLGKGDILLSHHLYIILECLFHIEVYFLDVEEYISTF
jgi:phosphate uptake regulator